MSWHYDLIIQNYDSYKAVEKIYNCRLEYFPAVDLLEWYDNIWGEASQTNVILVLTKLSVLCIYRSITMSNTGTGYVPVFRPSAKKKSNKNRWINK